MTTPFIIFFLEINFFPTFVKFVMKVSCIIVAFSIAKIKKIFLTNNDLKNLLK